MPIHDISLEKAELLSVLLEGLLYGFSVLMFGGTLWSLLAQRPVRHVNYKVVIVACSLLLLSTVHFVIDIIRVMQGLILFRDTFPGGPNEYFSNTSQWTFVSKNYVYAIHTLVGDGVVLYRCYAVWQSKLIMILPMLLWCAVGVTGIASASAELEAKQYEVFSGSVSRWITSFWASTLITNVLTTTLLAYRIWYVDRKAARLCGQRQSQLRPILHVVIDAGLVYSVTLFVALICFINQSKAQYLILDLISPIISITFYMVIIRVGLAHRASQSMKRLSLGNGTDIVSGEPRSRGPVPVLFPIQTNIESGPRSPVSPPTSADQNRRSKITFEHVDEMV